jgi:hypothetical protein
MKQIRFNLEKALHDRPLFLIYIIACCAYVLLFLFGPRISFSDTGSYYYAKNLLLYEGKLDHIRTPLYPLFLGLTNTPTITILFQYLIFIFSIAFFYAILNILNINKRLIFVFMLVYIMHPVIIFQHSQLLTESLSLSLSVFFVYFLVKYIVEGRYKFCWALHILLLILIFLKPAYLFLFAISFGILLYIMVFNKKNFHLWKVHLLALVLSITFIVGYQSMIKKDYGVFGITAVSDVNLYWMLRKVNLIDTTSIQANKLKEDIIAHTEDANCGAMYVLETYGWPELHRIVNLSLKKNIKSFLFGRDISRIRAENFANIVGGVSIGGNLWNILFLSSGITFYQLSVLLLLYFCLLLHFFLKTKIIPIISFAFFIYTFVNLLTILFLTPNDYGRIIIPSLIVILLIIMQMVSWLLHKIRYRDTKLFIWP